MAWLAITGHCASGLSVEQTPPTSAAIHPEATRLDGALEPLTRVVSAHDVGFLHDVVTDGYDRTQPFSRGVRSVGLQQMGQLRADAHRRALYQGPQGPGPGRPQTSEGKVNGSDLSRRANVATEDDHLVLSHQRLHHVQCQCNLGVVVVVDTPHHRRAVRLSTAGALDALTRYRSDTARFHRELLFRDAKPLTGLTACQARAQAKLDWHGQARVTAVRLATLEARHQSGQASSVCAMASLKRRACTQPLIDRLGESLATGHRLEKSSPAYDTLCNDGLITELAA